MLQQTQVKTVIPYFTRFITHFPDLHALSVAPEDEVLALWSGLGYYSRARNLHRTAQMIRQTFNGQFPEDVETLITLPGIGASTAAAISALAFEKPSAILDGNVKRVLSRYFLVEGPVRHPHTEKQLLKLASLCLATHQPREYTQAIMDLGATCCTPKNPTCPRCPVNQHCQAHLTQQAHIFPHKPQRQAIPHKTTQFLLLHTADTVYLEKRPNQGIWGGLWCLPLLGGEISAHSPQPFMQLKHQFTHFQLRLDIFRQQLTTDDKERLHLKGSWVTQTSLDRLGLPKPMKSILDAHWTPVDVRKATF